MLPYLLAVCLAKRNGNIAVLLFAGCCLAMMHRLAFGLKCSTTLQVSFDLLVPESGACVKFNLHQPLLPAALHIRRSKAASAYQDSW